jgi:hypothetical protein
MMTAAKRCKQARTQGREPPRGRWQCSLQSAGGTNLGVVLSIAGMQGNVLEIQLAAQVHSGHHILQRWDDA